MYGFNMFTKLVFKNIQKQFFRQLQNHFFKQFIKYNLVFESKEL